MNSTCPRLQSEELSLASWTFGEVLKESQVHGELLSLEILPNPQCQQSTSPRGQNRLQPSSDP